MLTTPGYPLYGTNNDGVAFSPTDEDRRISAVTKEVTKYVTTLMALSGFNNFSELSDLDKKYLFDKTCGVIKSLNDLKDIFQVNEITDGKGDGDDGC